MRHIDIVFDGPPSHESGRFVEVEDEYGYGIRYGHWIRRPDGYWALRLLKDEKANRPHCHVAGTMTGKHIDECSLCGRDLRDDIHAGQREQPENAEELMNDPEHTPGPWRYAREDDYWSIEPTDIGGKDNMEGNEADYRLIAAAPDMLTALHRCVEVIEFAYMNAPEQPKEISEARAAIAKAKGREPR